ELSLDANIKYWKTNGNIDTLISFIPLKGQIAYKKQDEEHAISTIYKYIEELELLGVSALQSVKAYQAATEYFDEISQLKESSNATIFALKHAENLKIDREKTIAQCHYNLGVQYGKMGNLELSKEHHLK